MEINSVRRNKLYNILLLIFSIILTLIIFEIATRIAAKDGLQGCFLSSKEAFSTDKELCENHYYEFMMEKGYSENFDEALDRGYLTIDKKLGVVNKPNTTLKCINGYVRAGTTHNWVRVNASRYCEELDGRMFINKQGIQSFVKEYNKTSDKLRIMFFGDSFTFGRDTLFFSYPNILQGLMPEAEILNWAVESSGIDNMYLRYKYQASDLDRDIIFLAIIPDDVSRAGRRCNVWLKPILNENLEIIEEALTPEELFEKHRKKKKIKSYFLSLMYYKLTHIKCKEKGFNKGLKMLDKIVDVMDNENENFFVLLLTTENYGDYEQWQERKIIEILEKKNIKYIMTRPIFEISNEFFTTKNIKENFYKGHFSIQGNAMLARAIKIVLMNQSLIKKSEVYFPLYDGSYELTLYRLSNNKSYPVKIMKPTGELVDYVEEK